MGSLVVVTACLLLIVRQRAAPLPSLALRLAACARARPFFCAVYVLGQGYGINWNGGICARCARADSACAQS